MNEMWFFEVCWISIKLQGLNLVEYTLLTILPVNKMKHQSGTLLQYRNQPHIRLKQ